MKDVVLDDLIEQDKKKKQLQFKRKGDDRNARGGRRLIKRGFTARGQTNGNKPFLKKPFAKGRDENQPRKFNKFNKNRNSGEDRQRPVKKQVKAEFQKKQKKPQAPPTDGPIQQRGRTLKVLGLHPDVKNQDLYKLFAAEGALQKCMIQQDNFGRNLPSAIVKYYSAEFAKKAVQNINNKKVMNSVLTVEPYRYAKK